MIESIEAKIKEGALGAYKDIIRFNKETDSDIKPEYLITVNVAQKIAELNDGHNPEDYPLRIKLEERARRFLNACRVYVPANTFDELFTLDYWEELGSDIAPKSKQRVDIAIYDKNDKPISIVEVKKFTQNPKTLTKDIRRELNFLGIYKGKVFKSQLDTAHLVFLFNDKDSVTKEQIDQKVLELDKFYNEFISALKIDPIIESNVDVFPLTESLLSSETLELPKDIQQYEFEKRHHYLGLILKFERKNTAANRVDGSAR